MRHQRRLDKDLFLLYSRQIWLSDHVENTEALLRLADDETERRLLLEILDNFEFLTSEKHEHLIISMARRICQVLNVEPSSSQIVTTAFDNEPDSSQLLLQMLKPKLPSYGGTKFLLRSKGMEARKKLSERPTIIMIDEFSGTGNTIISRVRAFLKEAQNYCLQKKIDVKPRLIVCLLAAMRRAREKIEEAGIEVYAELEMPAGISERNRLEDVEVKLKLMRRIETRLDESRMKPFPSLGFGEAEALFAIMNGNAPNSNFPVLWWRHLADGSKFNPLLERNEPLYEY